MPEELKSLKQVEEEMRDWKRKNWEAERERERARERVREEPLNMKERELDLNTDKTTN